MLNIHQTQQILRLHQEGVSISAIAREVGVSRDSVRKYIANPGADIQIRPRQRRRSKLDAIPEPQLRTLFEKSGGNCVVCVRLLAGPKYEIKIDQSSVFRYITSHYPDLTATNKKPAVNCFESEPGEQLQIDFVWVDVLFQNSDHTVKVPVFEAVYTWSRKLFVRVCPDMTQASWLLSLTQCFLQHGLPKSVLCDNDVALVKRSKGESGKFTAAFYWLCHSLGVKIRACRPYHPQTKGRIERAGRYIKENALVEINYLGIKDHKELQARLDSWILSVADHRRVPALNGMTVADAFKKEQSLLLQITPERQKKLMIQCGLISVSDAAFIELFGERLHVNYHLRNRKLFAYVRPDGHGVLCNVNGSKAEEFCIPEASMLAHRFEDRKLEPIQQDLPAPTPQSLEHSNDDPSLDPYFDALSKILEF